MTPKDVLKELFDLLEDYAPAWFTEEHRNRAAFALQESDEVHRPGLRDQEITIAKESAIKKKQTRKTSRPILAAVTKRKPVKPEGGPSPQ